MKVYVAAVLALAVVASAIDGPVYDYHRRIGIPRTVRLKELEEQYRGQRIVGGNPSDISETPYQLALLMQAWIYTTSCGASLIGEKLAITAAHCKYDDVAQPIALPSGEELSENFVGWEALASGYGITSDSGEPPANRFLSSVILPIITNAECYNSFYDWVHDTTLCTSGEGAKGTCAGDSGGPLVVDSNGRKILVGVSSYVAIGGCEIEAPAAFTRVTSYVDWIATF